MFPYRHSAFPTSTKRLPGRRLDTSILALLPHQSTPLETLELHELPDVVKDSGDQRIQREEPRTYIESGRIRDPTKEAVPACVTEKKMLLVLIDLGPADPADPTVHHQSTRRHHRT